MWQKPKQAFLLWCFSKKLCPQSSVPGTHPPETMNAVRVLEVWWDLAAFHDVMEHELKSKGDTRGQPHASRSPSSTHCLCCGTTRAAGGFPEGRPQAISSSEIKTYCLYYKWGPQSLSGCAWELSEPLWFILTLFSAFILQGAQCRISSRWDKTYKPCQQHPHSGGKWAALFAKDRWKTAMLVTDVVWSNLGLWPNSRKQTLAEITKITSSPQGKRYKYSQLPS